MKNLKKIIFIGILLLIGSKSEAQQLPIYSQYMFNDYVINPGVAGTLDYIPLKMTYRNQWTGFNGAPKTVTFTGHSPLSDHIGMGTMLYSDVTGPISNSGLQLSYNFRFPVSGKYCEWDKRKFLSLSLSTKLNQFTFDNTNEMNYSQHAPDGLGVIDPVLPEGMESSYNVYYSLAAYFYSERLYAGISALDIFSTSSDLNILSNQDDGFTNNIVGQYNFMVGYYYPIDQQLNWAVEPSLLLKKTSYSDMQYHLNAKLIYQDFIWLGMSYRQFDSFVILLGADYGQYFFGYSYDTSVSNINNYNSGSHEIIIGYNFNISRKRDNTRLKKRFEDRRNLLNPFKEYKRL
ncbi:MAG: hypothetical protein CBC73_01110 [Flavobacteriales bacterium TMED113]|nr:MAG: hypothetical protein CBC73_01110 [Flavobacteriales bacterium TMED113]